MSGLIKHRNGSATIARLPVAPLRPVDPPPCDPRLDALELQVADLEQALTDERARAERAIADARKAGRTEAEADDAARTGAVARGIDDAVTAWRERLAEIDGLAASLACAALTKLFGESADLADLTTRALSNQVDRIGRHAIISVRVSGTDFPDPAALAALSIGAGLSDALVQADPSLPAGACRVALRLGEVELDPLAQWSVIARALTEMAGA